MERRQPPTWNIGLEYPAEGWWDDPDLVVHVFPNDSTYAVAVELLRPPDRPPVVSGVAIRTVHMLSGVPDEPVPLSPRDIQRLPLSRIVRAALAAAAKAPRDLAELDAQQPPSSRPGAERMQVRNRPDVLYYDHGDDERFHWVTRAPVLEAARSRLVVPRGGPSRSEPAKSAKFYIDILTMHNELAEQGHTSPVKEIARRKNVPANRVHQWLYRARHSLHSESGRPPQAGKDDDGK